MPDEPVRGKRLRKGCLIAVLGAVLLPGLLIGGLFIREAALKRRIEGRLAEIRERGEPVTWEDVQERRRPFLPPENESAYVLLPALDLIKTNETGRKTSCIRSLQETGGAAALTSEPTQEIAGRHIEDCSTIFAAIGDASRLGYGQYLLRARATPHDIHLDYLQSLREGARLCALRTVQLSNTADGGSAARSVQDGLRLTAPLCETWHLMDLLVAIAMDAISVESLQTAMDRSELPARSSVQLRGGLLKAARTLSLRKGLLGERASAAWLWEHHPEEVLEPVHWRNSEHPRLHRALYGLIPELRQADRLAYLDMMERLLEVVDAPVSQVWSRLQGAAAETQIWNTSPEWQYPYTTGIWPGMRNAMEAVLRVRTLLRSARCALAVDQYRMEKGRWPDGLGDLVPEYLESVPLDPFTGDPLLYRATDEGVVVYSVGPDGFDDAGLSQDEVPGAYSDDSDTTWDIRFRLIKPKLRGAQQATLREELSESWLGWDELVTIGFDQDILRDAGLTDEDIEALQAGRPIPASPSH